MPPGPTGPLVSVIVPAFNAEKTLGETLQSGAAQTYANIEIVIVDDGSTDSTAEIAAEFCAREPRARLVRQENRGLAGARNRGVRESSGPWIAPLDADDLFHPTTVEKQVRAALAAPAPPGFVYCWYQDIDEQGFVLGSGPRWAFHGAALKRLAYQSTIHTVLLSRSAVESVGGYDESLKACEDVMIQLRIARSWPVAAVPEHLVGYRKRAGSMSRDTALVIRSWQAVLDRLVAEGADLPPRLRRWVDSFLARIAAEERLRSGSAGEGLRLFLRALRSDPGRWGRYAAYRLARTAVRLLRGRRPAAERTHFLEADPRIFVSPDPDELPAMAASLARFEEARIGRLAAMERLDPR